MSHLPLFLFPFKKFIVLSNAWHYYYSISNKLKKVQFCESFNQFLVTLCLCLVLQDKIEYCCLITFFSWDKCMFLPSCITQINNKWSLMKVEYIQSYFIVQIIHRLLLNRFSIQLTHIKSDMKIEYNKYKIIFKKNSNNNYYDDQTKKQHILLVLYHTKNRKIYLVITSVTLYFIPSYFPLFCSWKITWSTR